MSVDCPRTTVTLPAAHAVTVATRTPPAIAVAACLPGYVGPNPSPTGAIQDFNPTWVTVGPAGTYLGWEADLHGWNLATCTRVTVNGVDVRPGSLNVEDGGGQWLDVVQYDPPLFPTPGVATVVAYLADGTVTAPPPTFEYRAP